MDNRGTLQDLIEARASDNAVRPFLIDADTGQSLDYAALLTEVRAVADYVSSQGIKRGQSVAYAMHNGRCCAVTVLGLLYGGYRAVAINLVAGRDVIAYVLSHSESILILTQSEHESLIRDAVNSEAFESACEPLAEETERIRPSVLSVDDVWIDSLLAKSSAGSSEGAAESKREGTSPESMQTGNDSDALLMYTSGTTGRPKGVVLSHGNLIAGGINIAEGHELSDKDRALCVLPLYHINGLCVTIMGPLVSAGSVVVPGKFSTSGFWEWVDRYQCSWFSVVPTQISYLLRDAEQNVERTFLRFGRSASAPLSPAMHANFEKRFGIPMIETMGLTETAAQILSNPMPPAVRKLGSPGLPVGDEVRIVDSQLNDMPQGQEGELLIKGANVMSRYFRNETATREAMVAGDWFRTGDLGCMDDEGYLFITGRLKELIIKGGENIAPREIDDVLYQHADVVEAAAFARPCDNFGQRVEAAVSVKDNSTVTEAQLLELCVERVGAFKCPDRIHFMAELPKGPSGKIQRKKLLELLT
ncbi:AMP-binding protein [Granulosicoccus antarcticus]|uniref:Putative sulfoacetate--CoA ligase n=1 Tax=Granulosicoccus antarcticus IMCC3135 TaxID=1192854 RepID=A0A2Z2P2C0_9GAMM|nr:AMP-binding protein [Granulosicoccus antarcticus]ASJ74687.1 putative sulfoacetate--CoA ligase [Granulosicoccus antarcticus IMCC3135]